MMFCTPDIYVGTIQAFHGNTTSAIYKRQVTTDIFLDQLGLVGDEQAEKKVHGGADRALCHYPQEHYAFWQARYPDQAAVFKAAAFGENMSTLGMTEEQAHIGDIFRWGNAFIQITQPRSPCYKLNPHTGVEKFSLEMQETRRCGWLYRVLAPGHIAKGSTLELVSRNSEISVAQAMKIAFEIAFSEPEYRRLLSAAGLSASWSRTMQNRLISQKIEDSSRRLWGS